MANHKELDVWKHAMQLSKEIYITTNLFPAEEKFGLTNQIRRCSVSVPSNIAEGAARSSDKEFIQFLYISLGSLAELETQMLLSKEVGILKETPELKTLELVRKEVLGLIRYLKTKDR